MIHGVGWCYLIISLFDSLANFCIVHMFHQLFNKYPGSNFDTLPWLSPLLCIGRFKCGTLGHPKAGRKNRSFMPAPASSPKPEDSCDRRSDLVCMDRDHVQSSLPYTVYTRHLCICSLLPGLLNFYYQTSDNTWNTRLFFGIWRLTRLTPFEHVIFVAKNLWI